MKIERTGRGFNALMHETYPSGIVDRLAQESSAIGGYADSLDKSGSSFLWIGDKHHLKREQVAEFIWHLQTWLDQGRMDDPDPDAAIERGRAHDDEFS